MRCRTIGCNRMIQKGFPVDTKGLCERCWEELNALAEMREEKNGCKKNSRQGRSGSGCG